MNETELVAKVISSFCDAIGVDFISKRIFIKFVIDEASGKTYEIQKSIIEVHDLIHEFEREHLGDLRE